MNHYALRFTREAQKDFDKLSPKLREKLRRILTEVLAVAPHDGKRLRGDLAGFYSLRLTYQDRILYVVDETSKTVCVHRCRTHYGD